MDAGLAHKLKGHLLAAKALREAMDRTAANRTDQSWYPSFKHFLRKYNDLALAVNALVPVTVPIDHYDMEKVNSRNAFNTTGLEQQDHFDGA